MIHQPLHNKVFRSTTISATCIILVSLLLSACSSSTHTAKDHFGQIIGRFGHTSGTFNRPRGIVHDPAKDTLFVVDWDGRIQKFTTNGAFRASWPMPEVKNGKPEDLCIACNGNVLVTDTHYHRIMEFSPSGQQLSSHGSYGKEPGQFIYPVGIFRDSLGNIYVSEYGGNDRIQKFAPDNTFITQWGKFGTATGEFQRPSGLAVDTNDNIYVSDAVNHRIQVFTSNGEHLRTIGSQGDAPGQFRYPYDVAIRANTMYVLEYGNQRAQKMTLSGQPIDMFGQPGSADGCFAHPWRFAIVGNAVFVSDTENGRVVELGDSF